MKRILLSSVIGLLVIGIACAEELYILNQSKYPVTVQLIDKTGMNITGITNLPVSSGANVTYSAVESSSQAYYIYSYQGTPIMGLEFYYNEGEQLTVRPFINEKIGIYYDIYQKTITINSRV